MKALERTINGVRCVAVAFDGDAFPLLFRPVENHFVSLGSIRPSNPNADIVAHCDKISGEEVPLAPSPKPARPKRTVLYSQSQHFKSDCGATESRYAFRNQQGSKLCQRTGTPRNGKHSVFVGSVRVK